MTGDGLVFSLLCGVVAILFLKVFNRWSLMARLALASRKADAYDKRVQVLDQRLAVERAKDPAAFDKMVAEYEASRSAAS